METRAALLSWAPFRRLPAPPDPVPGAARPPRPPMSTPLVVLLLVLLLVAVLVAVMPRLGDLAPGADGAWSDLEPLDLGGDEASDLPASIAAAPGPRPGLWRLTVSASSDLEGESCALVGTFNQWDETALPMERTGDGRWRVEVELEAGVHRYKFCLDGERWVPDPASEENEDDGFGSENSVLRLGALGRPETMERVLADGAVNTAALAHDPALPLYRHRLADGRVRLRYRTLDGDVDGVALLREGLAPLELAPIESPSPFLFWQVDLDAPAGAAPLGYRFAVRDGELGRLDPREHVLDPAELPEIRTPDWAKEAIWYQIFPERFRNGDPTNDPELTRRWTSDWNEPAAFEGEDGQTFWEFYVYQRMYGGDLKGIADRLDHLQELGVDAIYLNPIFQAEGPHKYNATDFRHVDTAFGAGEDHAAATANEDLADPSTWTWTPSDRLFLDFLAECKARGLRVILDAVFNHVGVMNPAFRDVQERGEESAFADWFRIRSWQPFEYAGWAGFGELPVFAKSATGFASEAVKEHVFAVTRRWMDPDGDGDPSDGIDGWRLDVPGEIAPEFWAEWRALVKSINPDAYISGEIWDRADRWLDGRTFDAVMNYRFAEPVVAWVGNIERKISVTELDRQLLELRLAYPAEVSFALMNLVDSHDTDRIASMLLNPDRPFDRSNQIQRADDYDSGRPHPIHFARQRLIALLQMTYVGAPMIYYGDEVGMWGADDPTNRQPMIWRDLEPYDRPDEVFFDEGHFAVYRELVALRRAHAALRLGSFRTVITDEAQDLWVFERVLGEDSVLVALTPSEAGARFELPESPAGTRWVSVLGDGGEDHGGSVRVPGLFGRVWSART